MNSIKLEYAITGENNKETLLFVHGAGGSIIQFKQQQDYLSTTMRKTGKKFALKNTADMCYDLIDPWSQPPKVPLLMLYGGNDLAFIRNASKAWHKKEPSSQCVEIPNANHIANQDNPEDFNRVLKAFLEGLIQNFHATSLSA